MSLRRYHYLVLVPLLTHILTTFMMVSLTTPSAANAAGASCTVNPSGSSDFSTIQDAVDDLDCTTVDIAPGVYLEHVVISRTVNLIGAGRSHTFIDANGFNRVLAISEPAAVVTITNVTIRNGLLNRKGGTTDGGDASIRHAGITTVLIPIR